MYTLVTDAEHQRSTGSGEKTQRNITASAVLSGSGHIPGKTWQVFIIENPATSAIWQTTQFKELLLLSGVGWDTTELCMHGLKDPVSKLPYRKGIPFYTTWTLTSWRLFL